MGCVPSKSAVSTAKGSALGEEEEEEDIGEPVDYHYEEAALDTQIVVDNTPLLTLDGSEAFTNGPGEGDFVLLPDTHTGLELRKTVTLAVGGYEEDGAVYFVASDPARKAQRKAVQREAGAGDY